MYIVKKPYELPQVDPPKCMYHVRPVNRVISGSNENGNDSVLRGILTDECKKVASTTEMRKLTNETTECLEDRQDKILKTLKELHTKILSIYEKFVTDKGKSEGKTQTLSGLTQGCGTGGVGVENIDIVVNANPYSAPYSLIFLGKLIENAYSNALVSFTSHLHSSFKGTVDMGIRSAFMNEKEDANVRFTIIWKNVSSCTMMVTPVNSTAVYNEANIARFLSRLLPASNPYLNYDCLDWNMLVKVDNLLEQADNPKITAFIEQELKTSKIGFLADELTIADLVLFSSVASKVSQGQGLKNVPQNVQKWVRKIEAVLGLGVVTAMSPSRTLSEPKYKVDGFPAVLHSEKNAGRFWVASRNISMGELIFSENALVIGPKMYSPQYPTCLGCYRGTTTDYSCSKCHWPVCSQKCEKVAQHANYECKVFKKNKVHPSARPQYYLFIQFLRALLLRKTNPEGFQKMMELEPHLEARGKNEDETEILQNFYDFLTDECKLRYDFDLVDKVVGINRINPHSLDGMNHGVNKRACAALFYHGSLFNHDCVPNTRSVIHENSDLTMRMEIYAIVDIQEGQLLTQTYVPGNQGTMSRRTILQEWFFDCTCKRCSDPSELGTFFSSVRCSKCSDGYMSPENSLDFSSRWNCNSMKCNHTKSCDEITELLSKIQIEIQQDVGNAERLEDILRSIVVYPLHSSHYIALTLQYEISQRVVDKLEVFRDYRLIRRCVHYCRNILKVVDIGCPGYSCSRGMVFYCLANLFFALLHPEKDEKCTSSEDVNNDDKVDLDEVKQMVEDGIAILQVEPLESAYTKLCDKLRVIQKFLVQSS